MFLIDFIYFDVLTNRVNDWLLPSSIGISYSKVILYTLSISGFLAFSSSIFDLVLAGSTKVLRDCASASCKPAMFASSNCSPATNFSE